MDATDNPGTRDPEKTPIPCHDIIMGDPSELAVEPPFSTLFPVKKPTLEKIIASIQENGFDPSRPINVWKERNVVVDGHTRRLAAIRCNITDVPICFQEFANENEAVLYAIKCQVDRRNLDDAEMIRAVREMDRRMNEGRPSKETASREAVSGRSSEETAKKLGTSRAKVEAARTVIDHEQEFPDIAKDVYEGRKSIRMGASEVGNRKRKKRSGNKLPPALAERAAKQPSAKAHRNLSSVVTYDAGTAAWLESFPLRSKVVAHRFDEDALIYRAFSERLGGFRGELSDLIGERSRAGQSTLYAAISRLSQIPPIKAWSVCEKCQGLGFLTKKPCGYCGSGGYIIPGF